MALKSLLRKGRGKRQFQALLPGKNGQGKIVLNFSARRIKDGELLIVASNVSAHNALNIYRKRWAIECLFGDVKTRGLNLEDTRLLIAKKLSLLFALVALAIAWARVFSFQPDLPAPPPDHPKPRSHGRTGWGAGRRWDATCCEKTLAKPQPSQWGAVRSNARNTGGAPSHGSGQALIRCADCSEQIRCMLSHRGLK